MAYINISIVYKSDFGFALTRSVKYYQVIFWFCCINNHTDLFDLSHHDEVSKWGDWIVLIENIESMYGLLKTKRKRKNDSVWYDE